MGRLREKTLRFTFHARARMEERNIAAADVAAAADAGEVIETYPDDDNPSELILGWAGSRPLHVLLAYKTDANECLVVTVYEPDSGLWQIGFREKRR